MNQKSQSKVENDFAKALQELAAGYQGKVSREKAEGILSEILQNWPEKEEKSGGWTGRISKNVISPLLPLQKKDHRESPEIPSVQITADTESLVESILHQILQIGAILVQLDPTPALNDTVLVGVDFPEAHLQIETQGRVVHKSPRGTAIEVSGLQQEDRLALQAIRDDLEQRKLREQTSIAAKTDMGMGPSVKDSILEAGVIPPVSDDEDPNRSFAPFGGRRGGQRRMVSTTMRRRFDLPDPDMHVAESTKGKREITSQTREFYGPAPKWFVPSGDPDRIEELAPERVLDILLQLSEHGFTGVLEFTKNEESEQYLFDSGYCVGRASMPRQAEEELGPMLKAAEKITKRQLAMAAAHADELGLSVERSLLELDILSPDALRHAIAGRLTFLLREFCTQTKGDVQLYDSRALPAGFLPQPPLRVHVAVERVIYDRLCRSLSQLSSEKRDSRMAADLDAYPEIVEQERDRLERAVTNPDQLRLLERVITGRRRLREVLTESPLSPAETFSVVFSLHRMGLLRFDHSLHATVVRERMRENVTVKYLSVHKASYFEVINVHWSSYTEVIKKAYLELREQFDPTKVPAELESEVHQRVKEINERVEAAYAALAKRETRHAYRTRIMPEYKLAHAIPLFMKQSELAERRGQWNEARDALLRVLEIEPGHQEGARRLMRVNQILSGGLSPDPKDTNM